MNRTADRVLNGFGGGSAADTAATQRICSQCGNRLAHQFDHSLAGEVSQPCGGGGATEDFIDAWQVSEPRLVLRTSHDFSLISFGSGAATARPSGIRAAATILAM